MLERMITEVSTVSKEKPRNKRYNLNIPEALFDEVQSIADENGTSVVDLLRRFIKLGLVAVSIEKRDDTRLSIIDSNGERELRLLV
ncbi:hypothetical protein [Desulfomicrobium baculatum]|uniref:Ribbon-helix-helix protein CopG domain-containing protein n=1 Tax=Desulfomicrobium baculatum (strain DSM 4028 / VKM B-1378 / X) TaxID=525897 RepID=C7LPG0_DESBD|nr:hypothetical protein [Desulfomicrobium baculatum]ACU89003.1 hypothetical protein Dbac_0886 [Desulfomicrobium baculatum DSM 4028]